MKKRKYGLVWQHVDDRDFILKLAAPDIAARPPKVDWRNEDVLVYDQMNLSSCTANAIARAFQRCHRLEKEKDKGPPSRLFIYYNERAIEGTVKEDSGAMIRDGFKTIAKDGACDEIKWPYKESNLFKKPKKKCYNLAKKHRAMKYEKIVQDANLIENVETAIAKGFYVVFGFEVYESFESVEVMKTGIMPVPVPGEKFCGCHAVCAVGYDQTTKQLIVANSWGPKWGQKGYFLMPYDVVTKYSDDFWTLSFVS